MTIHGVGIDIVDIGRVERMLARSTRFAHRWFTSDEVEQCSGARRPAQAYAERLAAKESVWKALGLGVWSAGVPWQHIQTLHTDVGFRVELTGSVAEACADVSIASIHVALTNSSGRAIAIAVVEGSTRHSLT